MKKCVLLLSAALMLTGCGSADSSAAEDNPAGKAVIIDWAYYGSLEELYNDSSAVFEGKIDASHSEYVNESTGKIVSAEKSNVEAKNVSVYTVYDITLTKPFKGGYAAGESVQLMLHGDGERLISENTYYPDTGKEYLFFADFNEFDKTLPMWLPSEVQCVYSIGGDSFSPASNAPDGLSFTLAELEALG